MDIFTTKQDREGSGRRSTLTKSVVSRIALSLLCVLTTETLAEPFPAELNLADHINFGSSNGRFLFSPVPILDLNGTAVSAAGDFDNDGIDDILYGNPVSFVDSEPSYGFMLYGSTTVPTQTDVLIDLAGANGGTGENGFVIHASEPLESLGVTVSKAGDISADGISDILIGARMVGSADNANSRAYLVYGIANVSASDLYLANLLSSERGIGSVGAVLFLEDSDNPYRSITVDGIGDFNGDGLDDILVVSGTRTESSLPGHAYVLFGTGTQLPVEVALTSLLPENGGDGAEGIVFEGSPADPIVSGQRAGDVNDDGLDDLLIATSDDLYVIFGRPTSAPVNTSISSMLPQNGGDGTAGYVVPDSIGTYFPIRYGSAGDVNGDGIDDVIIGKNTVIDPGSAHVIFGTAESATPLFDLTQLLSVNGGDGSRGFTVLGTEVEGVSGFGSTVAGTGDVNGDGIDDMVFTGYSNAFLLYGQTQPFSEMEAGELIPDFGGDGTRGVYIKSNTSSLLVSSNDGGDFNNDGYADVTFGGEGSFGYVLFGRGTVVDDDNDGLANSEDNCTLGFNPDQLDSDADGFGNLCDADFNQDCTVNFLDLNLFANEFPGVSENFDLNSDGAVNFLDLDIFKDNFLLEPGPSGLSSLCSVN